MPRKSLRTQAKSATEPVAAFPVVGVGASADGLETFTALLKGCRPTATPVREVTDGVTLEPDHV
jgi:chemotaxis response regulator CheB